MPWKNAQVFEREHAVGGEEEEEAEEAAPHRVRRVRGAAAHDQAHAHLRRGTRKRERRGPSENFDWNGREVLGSLLRAIVKLNLKVKKDARIVLDPEFFSLYL